MPTELTGHVSRAEWRWVVFVSLTLLLLAFMPYVVAALMSNGADWQFAGALHDTQNAAASLSRMVQGTDGDWLVHFMYTPQPDTSALVQPIYPALGQLSRFTLRAPVTLFHLARLVAGFFMYVAIYQLAANIWTKVRSRRAFFIIASIGSGVGWLYALLTGLPDNTPIPDFYISQAYPFFSTLANVHYPLTIAGLALLAGVMIPIFRPGSTEEPSVENDAVVAFLVGLALAFLYPDALLPIAVAFVGSMLVRWYRRRKLTLFEWRWGLWVLVPALPIVMYNIAAISSNPAIASWIQQRGNITPSPLMLIVGLGLPLVLALPALWRAVREFQADGDRFMLLWLLAMIILMYLPLGFNHYFLVGLMLPIAYFATHSLEDVWLNFVDRRLRRRLYIVLIPTLALSHLFVLILPLIPISNGWIQPTFGTVERGYISAMTWLEPRTSEDSVTLAAPDIGLWVPVWAQTRTVYGHPAETMNARDQETAVREWYRITSPDDPQCQMLLDDNNVDYVLLGIHETIIGAGACTENLRYERDFNDVEVYRVP